MKSVRVLDTRDKRELQNDIDRLLTMKANRAELPTTPDEVGADYKGAAEAEVSRHNNSTATHSDIRMAIKKINDKVDAVNDSLGGEGYMTLGNYSFVSNSDGHLTLVYTG